MEGSLVMNNFVEEEGRLIIRDLAGNRLSTFKTTGFFPYRTAQIVYSTKLFGMDNVRVDYTGQEDNHRVYAIVDITTLGRGQKLYVAVSDGGMIFGTEVYERDW